MKTLLLLITSIGLAQVPQSIPLAAPPPNAVSGINGGVVGNQGSATYYYWVVANYPIGSVISSNGSVVRNVPDTLSASNYVSVSWNGQGGTSSYDLLRTSNNSQPTGSCNCAVSVATTSTVVRDQSNSLNAYTVPSNARGVSGDISINNKDYVRPYILWNLPAIFNIPVKTITFGDGTTQTTAATSGVAGVSSFNTRTGIVTLTSGDVTTALGYTPGTAGFPGVGVGNSTGSAWGTSYTVGIGANNLVQLNGSSQLPAVSGALLTNLPSSMVYPGAGVPLSTGSAWSTSYTVGVGASNLVQLNGSSQLPAVSAALLTNFPTLNQNTTGTAAGLTNAYIDWNAGSGGASILNKPTVPTITGSSVLKGSSGNAVAALAADVYALWSGTCSASTYLRGDGSCQTPTSGSGTVTTTGTPANGNLTKFSGATSVTNADLSGDATTSGTLAVTVGKINGVAFSGLATGIVKNTTTTGVPSIATDNDTDAVAFCADAGSTDTYTCSLSPAIATYVTGNHYRFKANTVNTGAASINLNSLGAKTIVKVAGGITTTLANNDIRAGQWVDIVYDGTNMQMQSLLGNIPAAAVSSLYNVIDYGADKTGVADSAVAIRAAVTAIGSASGTLYFPTGTYRFASAGPIGTEECVRINNSISLLGDGIGKTIFIDDVSPVCMAMIGYFWANSGGNADYSFEGDTGYAVTLASAPIGADVLTITTVAQASNFPVGQYVYLRGASVGGGQYHGELNRVKTAGNVTTGAVVLEWPLSSAYTTDTGLQLNVVTSAEVIKDISISGITFNTYSQALLGAQVLNWEMGENSFNYLGSTTGWSLVQFNQDRRVDFHDNIINNVVDGGVGIDPSRNPTDWKIHHNQIAGAVGAGEAGANISINGNTISCINKNICASLGAITGGSISGNTIFSTTTGSSSTAVYDTNGAVSPGSRISSNLIICEGDITGITAETAGTTISDNVIYASTTGIDVRAGSVGMYSNRVILKTSTTYGCVLIEGTLHNDIINGLSCGSISGVTGNRAVWISDQGSQATSQLVIDGLTGSDLGVGISVANSTNDDPILSNISFTTVGTAYSGFTPTLRIPGTLFIPSIKSTTGVRYLCIDSAGQVVSQAAACVGT